MRIGFSLLFVDKLVLSDHSKIGHLNFIKIPNLVLKKNARIGRFNVLKGSFQCALDKDAVINNKNHITGPKSNISYGESLLRIGELSIVGVGHHLDLTRSISIGSFSILAGIRSQLWTHGFYHAEKGSDRIRVDGEIEIGDNVYVGSGCIFNPGVKVSNAIHLGAGSVVSKNLEKPGMYVGQALRYIDTDFEKVKGKLSKVESPSLDVKVYQKQ